MPGTKMPEILPILLRGDTWIIIINYFVGFGGFLAMCTYINQLMSVYHKTE